MPNCEICGIRVPEVYECVECKSMFCKECGDLKIIQCFDCGGWEEHTIKDLSEEYFN
jgi:hypothetical protein